MKKYKKLTIIFSIAIAIFTIGIVFKTFQNDTFFNIAIGKYILENGIDMQEHFSWVQGLSYTFSHWAFDIVIYLIYKAHGFEGIYEGVIIFSIVTNVILFNLLNRKCKSPVIAFVITIISSYVIRECYTARSQIISFVCFIIEIYSIEQLIETNKKRYILSLIILSVVIANFHAATWALYLVLFLPYIGASFFNGISAKNIYTIMKNRAEKKLSKEKKSEKVKKYEEDVKIYDRFIKEIKSREFVKLVRRENYNIKVLIVTIIIICFTGLLTPIHDVPYTYIIKSMFGPSNFENTASVDYIAEMCPIIPITNIAILVFLTLFITFLAFMPTKLKLEHGFLVLGLFIMTLSSMRYIYLLVFLGSYVIVDLISQSTNEICPKGMEIVEKICGNYIVGLTLIIFVSSFSIYKVNENKDVDFVNKEKYPIGATEYIKNNLDYKNIRIYNDYSNGSYLMLNEIPVFIDSRLDVYCSEFNDTDVFYDYIKLSNGNIHYEEIFTKNNFTHILMKNTEIVNNYIKFDNNYKILYEDEVYTLYERNVNKIN